MRIELSRQAKNDLSAIRRHIAEDNEIAAERTILRIAQSIRYLSPFPELGYPWEDTETRAHLVPSLPYRIHYQIVAGIVEIITIVHTSRKYPPLPDIEP